MMRGQVQTECDRHSDPCECPDNLIYHDSDPSDERYGLFIHDGGSSYITIRYWPGSAAPIGDSFSHAACLAGGVMMVSYSIGVNRDRGRCRRRRW
ncbi:DUF6980 family protein [Salinispora pacifica]|uniref:DUF6980 family protein n=1 Tax=Salinispora pacifica TaxID=351187 RepID=UPI003B506FDC